MRCHDRPDCKKDEEITKFLKNKFLLLIFNQVRFDSRYFGEEAIIPESKINWVPVNTQIQQTIPFKVSTTELFLQDVKTINLDDLTELADNSIFKLE